MMRKDTECIVQAIDDRLWQQHNKERNTSLTRISFGGGRQKAMWFAQVRFNHATRSGKGVSTAKTKQNKNKQTAKIVPTYTQTSAQKTNIGESNSCLENLKVIDKKAQKKKKLTGTRRACLGRWNRACHIHTDRSRRCFDWRCLPPLSGAMSAK
jgi:hypothetical protein